MFMTRKVMAFNLYKSFSFLASNTTCIRSTAKTGSNFWCKVHGFLKEHISSFMPKIPHPPYNDNVIYSKLPHNMRPQTQTQFVGNRSKYTNTFNIITLHTHKMLCVIKQSPTKFIRGRPTRERNIHLPFTEYRRQQSKIAHIETSPIRW